MGLFQKAVKSKSKLRCAIFGPSGAGKTYTALRIAQGMGGSIGLIDTERSSASKYADKFNFVTVDLENKTIQGYVNMISAASKEGLSTIIIDSLSHGWQELLDEVDKIAKAKFRGNTWSAWSEGTPKQRSLVNAIVSFPGHVIATMRSKTEWTQEEVNGKKRPVRVGLSPEQGKGIEYEFDLLMEMSTDHIANVIKDRTGKFQDRLIEKPDEKFGQELIGWLMEGEDVKPKKIANKPVPSVRETNVALKKGVRYGEPVDTELEPPPQYFEIPASDKDTKVRFLKDFLGLQGVYVENRTLVTVRTGTNGMKTILTKDPIDPPEEAMTNNLDDLPF